MSTYLRAHQHIAGVDAGIEDYVQECCCDELLLLLLLLLWDRKPLVGDVATRTLGFCGTTLIIDAAPVSLLCVSIDGSLDEVREMSNEQCVMEEPGEDKPEVRIAGGRSTSSADSPTTHLISSTGISLDPPVEAKPSLGSEKTMDQPETGCRSYRTHTERKPGEELSAPLLSHKAARKARKATSKAALVSNVSTTQEALTPSGKMKEVAKRGRDARKKDPAPPAVGSDYSDTSVVTGPSDIKPAVSSKPGGEAKVTDVTAEALNQADNPCTCKPGQFHPPELESFYKKARRDQKWTGRAKQLKASLVGAKSTAEKETIANAIYALMDEVQAELGADGAPIAPRGLRWETASTFEIQAPTREDKVVRKALDALMKSKALKELGVGDDYDFSEFAQQWWDRHRPSTAVQKDLEPSTIEALSLYGDHIRKLMQCRANLDLRMRAHSAASSRFGSTSKTLQCLVRQGTYSIDFWQSRQKSAQRGVRQATKALREARAGEARMVSTVSP